MLSYPTLHFADHQILPIHLLNVLGDNYSFKDCKVIYDAHKNKLFEQDEAGIKIYDNGELVFDGMLNRNDKR